MIWKDGVRVPATDDFGRPVQERVPQAGRVGLVRVVADIEGLKPQAHPRYIAFLHADGNICNDPITSAAASSPGNDKSFEIGVRQKARRHGWIPAGCCPIDAAMRHDITSLQLMAMSNREAFDRKEACGAHMVGVRMSPCPHFLAEEAARKALRMTTSKESDRRSAADRQADALVDFVKTLKAKEEAEEGQPAERHPNNAESSTPPEPAVRHGRRTVPPPRDE